MVTYMKIDSNLNELSAFLLAIAINKVYDFANICNWEVNEDGFFIDLSLTEKNISTNDFSKIERAFNKLTSGALKIEYEKVDQDQALKLFKNNKYISYLIKKDLQPINYVAKINDNLFLTSQDKIEKTNAIKAFKLINVGGSYWLGDASKEQLTRIYGVAFDSKDKLDEFIKAYNEKLESDHRTIGKILDLFTFDQLAGQGLPIWLPNGSIIKKEIRNFLSELEFKYGFDNAYTPILGNIDLYKKSGHWDHYKENIFPPMQIDNEQLILRPMTCPHHILIYKKKVYSYKQLPIRLCEESMLHRYESSGGLTGLERVREMVLEDTHIFCTPEQVEQEVFNCYKIINEAYAGLGCKIHQVDLSLHDPNNSEKFHNDKKMWNLAENNLRKMLREKKINFTEKVGEAAFYGPKIDFQVKTNLGRIITMSTIQLDFLLPKHFELEYKNEKSEFKTVIMIHLGIVGTYERLLSIILEQTKGNLPLWLSPQQVIIIPVSDEQLEYANKVNDFLRSKLIRSRVDNRDERMAKKIRDAQVSKIPYQIVIGNEEINNNTVAVRKIGAEKTTIYKIDEFLTLIKTQIDKKSN